MATKFVGKVCPRCGADFHKYPGLSRWDNTTEICNPCEQDEGFEDYFGKLTPMHVWPVERPWTKGTPDDRIY